MKGETEKAILRYEALLKQTPDNVPMLLRLLNLYWQKFHFDRIGISLSAHKKDSGQSGTGQPAAQIPALPRPA